MKFLIIILAFIGAMHLGGIAEDKKKETLTPQPSDYSEVYKITADHDENTCSDNSEYFDINFKVVYVASITNFAGQWSPVDKILSLSEKDGLDIGTVAHEVSHMVDTIMESHHLADEHYEAYLQGAYTTCVWMLVKQDLIESEQPKFRFVQ